MHANLAVAYKQAQKTAMSDREIEAAVLMKAAATLKQCQTRWEDSLQDGSLDKALRYDQQVWTVFQAAVVEESNPLPEALKQNIMQLSLFVDRKIFELMCYPEPHKLDILIKINTNLAMGLRGNS
ncbi:MAG: flagellar biosynthesis regulator FlaF [Ignavibacteriales bacterium]|nr:flagellar biosynthesis regulator FlaF [Ignavibacteriales bacterium]